jgi:hypothetical protein
MAPKKSTQKKKTVNARTPRKLALDEQMRAAVKHFPKLRAAAHKTLRDAGVKDVRVHMMFRADGVDPADPCQGACKPDETCVTSSTGKPVCVPNHLLN